MVTDEVETERGVRPAPLGGLVSQEEDALCIAGLWSRVHPQAHSEKILSKCKERRRLRSLEGFSAPSSD